MMLTTVGRVAFLLCLPERAVRAVAASLGGALHETFELALPRVVRRSRLYEATAKNLLRVTIELVGGVPPQAPVEDELEPDPGRLAVRKGAGNVVELGSIAAFGFSPLWILAAAADVTHGSRTYLDAFVDELVAEARCPRARAPARSTSCSARSRASRERRARLVDIPPLELAALRQSLDEIRRDAASLPSPGELARVYDGLREAARRERTSLLEVSVGIGLAFFNSARHVGRQHVLDPYTEDLRRCATRASARTRGASRARTPRRSRGTSTPTRRRSPSAGSSGCAAMRRGPGMTAVSSEARAERATRRGRRAATRRPLAWAAPRRPRSSSHP